PRTNRLAAHFIITRHTRRHARMPGVRNRSRRKIATGILRPRRQPRNAGDSFASPLGLEDFHLLNPFWHECIADTLRPCGWIEIRRCDRLAIDGEEALVFGKEAELVNVFARSLPRTGGSRHKLVVRLVEWIAACHG